VEDEKTDLSAHEAKVKQSKMLEVGLRMLAFKARRDGLAVLTPEQREKGKAAHEKRMQERMSGHGGGSANETTINTRRRRAPARPHCTLLPSRELNDTKLGTLPARSRHGRSRDRPDKRSCI
jgi:hypothetical protein